MFNPPPAPRPVTVLVVGEWSAPIQGLMIPWSQPMLVTDAKTGRKHVGPRPTRLVQTEAAGRVRYAPGALCQLLRSHDGFDLVKLPNGVKVHVKCRAASKGGEAA